MGVFLKFLFHLIFSCRPFMPKARPLSIIHWTYGPQTFRSQRNVFSCPMTTNPLLARVSVTLHRLGSETKPKLLFVFARTVETIMSSFSRP